MSNIRARELESVFGSVALLAKGAKRMAGAEAKKREVSWESLEQQDWHLWILAVLLLFVLGISLLSFMFPSVFWLGHESSITAPQRAFFGFCVLLGLTLVYMLQRQAMVRRLKRSLYQAQAAALEAEQEVHLISLTSLPELGQFRDSLAMEYRRASHAGDALSVILVIPGEGSEDLLGQAVQLLRQMLRPHETVFRVALRRFAVILPMMSPADVAAFAAQIEQRLRRALPGGDVSTAVIAYPEQAGSLSELESRVRLLSDMATPPRLDEPCLPPR